MKNVLKKSVLASSVLHNIACNYKLWKIRHTERQTSFFSKTTCNKFFQCLQSSPSASTRSLQLPFVVNPRSRMTPCTYVNKTKYEDLFYRVFYGMAFLQKVPGTDTLCEKLLSKMKITRNKHRTFLLSQKSIITYRPLLYA